MYKSVQECIEVYNIEKDAVTLRKIIYNNGKDFWYLLDDIVRQGQELYLLENEKYPDKHIIINKKLEVIMKNCRSGFIEYDEIINKSLNIEDISERKTFLKKYFDNRHTEYLIKYFEIK